MYSYFFKIKVRLFWTLEQRGKYSFVIVENLCPGSNRALDSLPLQKYKLRLESLGYEFKRTNCKNLDSRTKAICHSDCCRHLAASINCGVLTLAPAARSSQTDQVIIPICNAIQTSERPNLGTLSFNFNPTYEQIRLLRIPWKASLSKADINWRGDRRPVCFKSNEIGTKFSLKFADWKLESRCSIQFRLLKLSHKF